jgi:hypothetical protein
MIEIYSLRETIQAFHVNYTVNEDTELKKVIKFIDLKQHCIDHELYEYKDYPTKGEIIKLGFDTWLADNKEFAIEHFLKFNQLNHEFSKH